MKDLLDKIIPEGFESEFAKFTDNDIFENDEARDYFKYHLLCDIQRWLMKRGIHVVVLPTITAHWTFKICKLINLEAPPFKDVSGADYGTSDQALLEGCKKAAKLI